MRIGKVIIDTDIMTTQELRDIIAELRAICARKAKKEELQNRMAALLAEAKEEKFDFVDKNFGQIWENDDFMVVDMR